MAQTTDLCIAAHQDDIEMMAYAPIAACFDNASRSFAGCAVTETAPVRRVPACMRAIPMNR